MAKLFVFSSLFSIRDTRVEYNYADYLKKKDVNLIGLWNISGELLKKSSNLIY
jgi:hypothetical protein